MKELVTIYIDGVPCSVEEGQYLVEAIRVAELKIPSLCYYAHIDPPLGTCRVCTVQVNGKSVAACTTPVREGMEVVLEGAGMPDVRKAIVEMMFSEGNHFCPACEKSGDCDLQGLAYEMGMTYSRFPHLFMDKPIDYSGKRILIDHNRCIRCRRCVEEIFTEEGEKVFSFHKRANQTTIAIDYQREAMLSEVTAIEAMHICPTGAIMVNGKSMARPRGYRKYDQQDSPVEVALSKSQLHQYTGKKRVATASLAGCFGCHMSLLDIDLDILDVLELVEIDKSPLTDKKRFDRRCDIGIIEGGCCNTENVEVLRDFRENCDVLVAMGECAIWGGLPAMRNMVPLEECLMEAYRVKSMIPNDIELPKILDQVYACNEVVKIDYYVPGCPPDASHIWKMIKYVLFDVPYTITSQEISYD